MQWLQLAQILIVNALINYAYAQEMNKNDTKYSLPVITSDLKIAADLGHRIIKKGGNAVDAAISTTIAVGAINSFASGLGGGGFLLIYLPDGQCFEYNFRERAPMSVNIKNYTNAKDSRLGRKAVAIPSEILGLFTVHSNYGALPWCELFPEIIEMLRSGFHVPRILSEKLKEFEHIIRSDKGLSDTFIKNGKVASENDILTRPNLANTLEILATDPSSFYFGSVGKSLLSFINEDGVIITPDEFKQIHVIKKSVVPKVVNNTRVYAPSLPTTGYMLGLAMSVFDKLKLDKNTTEEELQVYLIKIYNELYSIRTQLEDLQDETKNIKSLMCHTQQKVVDQIVRNINEKKPFTPHKNNLAEDHGTTHINVMDAQGMMVALTSTINNYWGAGLMDPVTGIILNNQIDDFAFTEFSTLNGISSSRSGKNHIMPFKQPLSSAMPAFIMKDSDIYLLGASGGIRIPTAVISTLARIFISSSTIKEAILHPRLHYQGGHMIKLENKYTHKLPNMGINWNVIKDKQGEISSCVHIIKYNTIDKFAVASSDDRKRGAAVGIPFEDSEFSRDKNENLTKKRTQSYQFVTLPYTLTFYRNHNKY
ncbi:gamma-glutamyltranspeptidase / glutathione hydrolase / leukotriene-C4 hydrolase [Nematocida parisii]|uniref:Glutathione hydrolase n=1 Tax=Nematocida parisii (strain ERTm3) TaxID=935791 RepID=I3EE63_NEMP3|nr:uncharacterized protein NEPG_00114 [Nematocida parisii ERTm1]EIJ87510.1 hypothetical protein NEQG_02391 [Nematocida parisii ERTm3]KAI5142780.1 gamma-glutamyltranspeptidase / glutathione hydrolase / leukotriene-C4 hydrolase [Nematocida parisii]EIJ94592.1 hypothetical protein NEPG_00114 [Nematocida parisii ERTm1]KAI5152969.1 gamma-glutamyltranspeptidase / glutathione hydrolase / leukotriene-C4 hydrolase [Nematocida parisii]KAI5157315.1 gamma-glutamyltranspeptidase / glutathione hydrolase / le|eukprot:XP_013057948.1 hypothetical protein NEPG_00114 [Nematocida parisii ERTm1]